MASKTRNPRSNAAGKLPTTKKKTPEGKPFNKGYDPRRNLKGRPRKFDEFRALALDIAEQTATTKDGQTILWNGQEITFAEFVLLSWVTDKKYLDQFAQIAYGKVPDEIKHHFDMDEFVRKYIKKFTDGQLERISKGENPLDVLAESLADKR